MHLFVYTDLPSISGLMMDPKSGNEESHNLEQCFHQDAVHYAVNYSHGGKTNEVSNLLQYSAQILAASVDEKMCSYMQAVHVKTEDSTKKR